MLLHSKRFGYAINLSIDNTWLITEDRSGSSFRSLRLGFYVNGERKNDLLLATFSRIKSNGTYPHQEAVEELMSQIVKHIKAGAQDFDVDVWCDHIASAFENVEVG